MHDLKPTHLDLFAGIGGFSLAFEAEGFRTVAYSEINPDKCLVFGHWFPGVPNLGAIESIRGADVRGAHGGIDVLTGGVPCQPASALGQMRGAADERWLWPQAIRVVREIRPRFAVFENPPSLLVLEDGRAWNGIVSGLAALRYDLWWDVFPAAAFGAGHLRERVLLVIANADRPGLQGHAELCDEGAEPRRLNARPIERHASPPDLQTIPAHAEHVGSQERLHVGDRRPDHRPLQAGLHSNQTAASSHHRKVEDLRGRVFCDDWWHEINTGIPVLADGLPARLVESAARCAGDAVVPQVIQPLARAIHTMLTTP